MNIEETLHTEQMQDVIGKPPRWIYRWGISFVLAIALICIYISSLINYPEAVNTQIKIRSSYFPHCISLKDSGILIKIIAKNDANVKKGDGLAVVKTIADTMILRAPTNGKLNYAGIIYESEFLMPGRNIFFIANDQNNFFGEMVIPQSRISKVKPGQTVLVKLRSTVDSQEASLRGKISYITSEQYKTGEFLGKVNFDLLNNKERYNLLLRNGTIADAEIITERTTLFQRLVKSLTKGIK